MRRAPVAKLLSRAIFFSFSPSFYGAGFRLRSSSISNSDSRLLARVFFIELPLFLLPAALWFVFPAYVLWRSGELVSVDRIVALQIERHSPTLAGTAYKNLGAEYKFKATSKKKAQVLALGSSRIMEFRSEFFTKPFYNAGRGGGNISYVGEFMNSLPDEALPKVLIVALDHSGFIDERKPNIEPLRSNENPHLRILRLIAGSSMRVYVDFLSGKFRLSQLVHDSALSKIGLTANARNSGWRNDGSYRYPEDEVETSLSPEKKYSDSIKKIRSGDEGYFRPASRLDDRRVAELFKLARFCKTKRIHLVAFLPPFAEMVYEMMRSRKKTYAYLEMLPLAISDAAAREGFVFYDFSQGLQWGISDQEMIDGLHASEKANVRLYLYMLSQDPFLSDFSDKTSLTHALKASTRKGGVFDN
jgi:hypothetical protein